ncbi:probable glycerol-3-phosphate dehydrogenase, mitochondrial [Drosophila sulfurigaster albostrigata]|uniref:probable glycerol-3-phosphate dehydrogenase, mitochondrial n=1 Tax=Drosophila sulfurigaster albostrigata TaxID=89887 RepID=UPI002D21940C|nr:probable glycerol-3-phosphate dehydrogenase, mitochondrial [Drosophila sulfurigaster albostrigata]
MLSRIQMSLDRCLQGNPQRFLSSLSNIFRRHRSDGNEESWKLPTRRQHLKCLKEQNFDVLVIGGGAVGCGCALDAASRGLRTALIEAGDFANGASSKSSKLVEGSTIHLQASLRGGDLQQMLRLQEVLSERATMLKIAPHLNRVQPMLMPIYTAFRLPILWLGLKLYDAMSGMSNLRASHFLSKEATLNEFPLLRPHGLLGSLVYYDSQLDDARMCLALALTAVKYGATVTNYVKLNELLPVNEESNCRKAVVEDVLTEDSFVIKSQCLINATGAQTDVLRKLDDREVNAIVQPTLGTHMALPGHFGPSQCGLIFPTGRQMDGQPFYMLPFENRTLVGCLETEPEEPRRVYPAANCEAVDCLLEQTRQVLNDCVLVCPDHVLSSWSGVMPTIMCPSSDAQSEITSNYLLEVSNNNLITLAGGSWSCYRVMAAEAIDTAIDLCCLESQSEASNTHYVLLDGGEEYCPLLPINLVQNYDLPLDVAQHLADTYGCNAYQVLFKTTKSDRQRLHPNFPYIKAEVDYACQREYACQLVDVIARRLRVAFVDASAAFQMLPSVMSIMSKHLCWTACTQKLQLKAAKRFLMQQMGLGTIVKYNPLPKEEKKDKENPPSDNQQEPHSYDNILATARSRANKDDIQALGAVIHPIMARSQTLDQNEAFNSETYLPQYHKGIAPRYVVNKVVFPIQYEDEDDDENDLEADASQTDKDCSESYVAKMVEDEVEDDDEDEVLNNLEADISQIDKDCSENDLDRAEEYDQAERDDTAEQHCEAKDIKSNKNTLGFLSQQQPACIRHYCNPSNITISSDSKLNLSNVQQPSNIQTVTNSKPGETSQKQENTPEPAKVEAAKSRLIERLTYQKNLPNQASHRIIKINSELPSKSNTRVVSSSTVKANSNEVPKKNHPAKVRHVRNINTTNLNGNSKIDKAHYLKLSEEFLKTNHSNRKCFETKRIDIKRKPIDPKFAIKKYKYPSKTLSLDDQSQMFGPKRVDGLFTPTAQLEALLSKNTYYEQLKRNADIRSVPKSNTRETTSTKLANNYKKWQTINPNVKAKPDLVVKPPTSIARPNSGLSKNPNTKNTFNIPPMNPKQR